MINEPKTPPIKETTNQPTTTPPSPNKPTRSKLPIILAVIIVLFLIGYIGYLIGKCLYAPQAVILPPSPFPLITKPTPTPDLISNWKTYENPRKGYLINYPSNWEVSENTLPANPTGKKVIQQDLVTIDVGGITPRVEIDSANQIDITLAQIKDKKISELKIDNLETYYEENMDEGGGTFISYYFVKNNEIYTITTITYPENSKSEINNLDKILSTFKFIDSTQAIDTSNWKTFLESEHLHFSIKYPPGWKEKTGTGLGNYCFASLDQKGTDQGIGGGYDMQEGEILCVSLLGTEATGDNYHKLICNQTGEIKGNGTNACTQISLADSVALKIERDYGNNYKSTMLNFETKGVSIYILSRPLDSNSLIIIQILSTFRFID